MLRDEKASGKIPIVAPNVTLNIEGGDSMGSFVNISVDEKTADGLYRFRRFSTKVDIATAFDVKCSVIWRASATLSASESNLLNPIAVLDGCNFVQKSATLLNDIDWGSAALSVDGNSRAYICFSNGDNKNHCEIFDGTSSISTTSSNYGHYYGSLGLYKSQPTTVGSFSYGDTKKVETLTNDGWSVIGDPPISDIRSSVLVGLQSGNLLMLGGAGSWNGSTSQLDLVWLLSNDSWSQIGTLKSAISAASSLKINDSLFLFPGYGDRYIERVDTDGDQLKTSETLYQFSSNPGTFPALFQVSAGFCA
ncbi:Oidioi.mRNA.OKI2018_I69.chr2.g5392.t1.cds [Oikopleura dioica]|uniref:Oidioi.mRNA.OKI2018_I69.chr2.g5392.t1.cds n=1 Tax=Oikopleura dioica TaxID=34765 RepID=A0ABN7T5U4_OIKDI|nr:Oidioi.mRNA.OKI2018_I69.chr2.g5392.t1.cds [Oikopleura dioica]